MNGHVKDDETDGIVEGRIQFCLIRMHFQLQGITSCIASAL